MIYQLFHNDSLILKAVNRDEILEELKKDKYMSGNISVTQEQRVAASVIVEHLEIIQSQFEKVNALFGEAEERLRNVQEFNFDHILESGKKRPKILARDGVCKDIKRQLNVRIDRVNALREKILESI